MSDTGRSKLQDQLSIVEYSFFSENSYSSVSSHLFKVSVEIFILLNITANIKFSNIV